MKNMFWNTWRKINSLLIKRQTQSYVTDNKIIGESEFVGITNSSDFNICAITVNGGPVWFCGKPSCKTCNVMTKEKAQKINARFLLERGYIK